MVVSAIFILDLKGKVLISRNYRGDIPMSLAENFIVLLQESEEEQALKPILSRDGYHYLYVKHTNVYLLAITRRNSNATSIFLFLHNLIEVFQEYFKSLEEESIRDNFVIIYELLDEMMDFGYPQFTEPKILKEYIFQKSHKLEQIRPPVAVTNTVSWRSEGIKYRKNEVFLDVIESVNILVASNGVVLSSEILGLIKMRCDLSGMPELKLGLNDRVLFESLTEGAVSRGKGVEMEDIKFHQCVRLTQFESDRTISFIPPDGEFELMSYRLNTAVKPVVSTDCIINVYSGTRVEIDLKAKGTFKKRMIANNVVLEIPVSMDALTPQFKMSFGTCSYSPERNAFLWKIKQFVGGKEYWLKAQYNLPSVKSGEIDKKRPITIRFEIPYFTLSGLQVRYLKITEKSGYQALPWVRYITQNGGGSFLPFISTLLARIDYHVRMPDPILKLPPL